MELRIKDPNINLFRAVLRFCIDSGLKDFTVRRSTLPPETGITRLPEEFYEKVRPFQTKRQSGPSEYVFTGELKEITVDILVEMLPKFVSLCKDALILRVGALTNTSAPSGVAFFRLGTSASTGTIWIEANDFEAECLFKRGIPFSFRVGAQDEWTPFGIKHVRVDPPTDLSPNRDSFDYERWPHRGISTEVHRKAIANDPVILRWWLEAHDRLLMREIERDQWAWHPPVKELVAITPDGDIEDFKATHPNCKIWVWYNVLGSFCHARAEEIGLLERIQRPRWVSCLLCGRSLHQQKSYIFCSPDQAFFCYPCVREHWWSPRSNLNRDDTLRFISELTAVTERVPSARFGTKRADFADLRPSRLADVLKLLRTSPSQECVKSHFGSWFVALVEAGVLPNGSQATNRGIRSVALDGHVCLSLGERTICDLFHRYGIKHRREVPYPGERAFRADWEIGDIFIEYLGLTGDPGYDLKSREKERIAAIHRKELIKIYPRDLANRSSLLRKLELVLGPDALENEQLPLRLTTMPKQ